jgi:hypothetical protein
LNSIPYCFLSQLGTVFADGTRNTRGLYPAPVSFVPFPLKPFPEHKIRRVAFSYYKICVALIRDVEDSLLHGGNAIKAQKQQFQECSLLRSCCFCNLMNVHRPSGSRVARSERLHVSCDYLHRFNVLAAYKTFGFHRLCSPCPILFQSTRSAPCLKSLAIQVQTSLQALRPAPNPDGLWPCGAHMIDNH